MSREHISWSVTAIILVVDVIVFQILNMHTPLRSDDLLYSFFSIDEPRQLSGIIDWVTACYNHYFTEDGRFANYIVRFFMGLTGKDVFNIVNAIIFALFLFSGTQLAGRTAPWTVLLLTVATFCVLPAQGETILWVAGACNYLWSVTFSLTFLILFRRTDKSNRLCAEKYAAIFFAFIAGMMHECFSISVLFGIGFYHLIINKKPSQEALRLIFAYMAGFAVLVMSPAIIDRFSQGADFNTNLTLLQMLSARVLMFANKVVCTPLFTFTIVSLIVAHVVKKRCIDDKTHQIQFVTAIWLGAIFTVFALGLQAPRVYFFVAVTETIVITTVAIEVLFLTALTESLLSLVIAAFCVPHVLLACAVTIEHNEFNNSVIAEIKASPDGVCLNHKWEGSGYFVAPNVFDSDVLSVNSRVYSQYYHKANVQFVSEGLMKLYREGTLLPSKAIVQPFESNDTTIASHIYQLPDNKHAIIPLKINDVNVCPYSSHYQLSDVGKRYGLNNRERKLWYWRGLLNNNTLIESYPLVKNDTTYLVLPRVRNDVLWLETTLLHHDKRIKLSFTRKQDNRTSL